jgi:large-conductance mechanosensitive channel
LQKKHEGGFPIGALISALVAILLSGQGLRLGIKALVAIKGYQRTSTFWKALVGSCINGCFILFIIFIVIEYAANRESHMPQAQQTEQGRQ